MRKRANPRSVIVTSAYAMPTWYDGQRPERGYQKKPKKKRVFGSEERKGAPGLVAACLVIPLSDFCKTCVTVAKSNSIYFDPRVTGQVRKFFVVVVEHIGSIIIDVTRTFSACRYCTVLFFFVNPYGILGFAGDGWLLCYITRRRGDLRQQPGVHQKHNTHTTHVLHLSRFGRTLSYSLTNCHGFSLLFNSNGQTA